MMRSQLLIARDYIEHADTFAEYRAFVLAKLERRGRVPAIDSRPLVPYVNYGRWVADCYFCFAGIALDPEWDQTFCLGCYRSYVSILWPAPADREAIEAALVVRWLRNQHWRTAGGMQRNPLLPGESIAELLIENRHSKEPPPPPVRDQPEAVWLGLLR